MCAAAVATGVFRPPKRRVTAWQSTRRAHYAEMLANELPRVKAGCSDIVGQAAATQAPPVAWHAGTSGAVMFDQLVAITNAAAAPAAAPVRRADSRRVFRHNSEEAHSRTAKQQQRRQQGVLRKLRLRRAAAAQTGATGYARAQLMAMLDSGNAEYIGRHDTAVDRIIRGSQGTTGETAPWQLLAIGAALT